MKNTMYFSSTENDIKIDKTVRELMAYGFIFC